MIVLENVTKTYRTRSGAVKALDAVSLRIEKGEFVVVRGPSGSGKTTLLMTIAAMMRPTSGIVTIDGRDLYQMSHSQRAALRASEIGFIFQMFHLVGYLTVLENVLLAGFAGRSVQQSRAEELLSELGMAGRTDHKPAELSTGEKQRTAIARALLNDPKILLADEPTGNLDPENGSAVFGYLQDFSKGGGTVVVATHRTERQVLADRTILLGNGSVSHAMSSSHQSGR